MSEELFGPICPVLKATIADSIEAINSLPRPLALYIFSSDKDEIDKSKLDVSQPSPSPFLC